MPNLPAQTIVAVAECLECGKDVNVKINKNGLSYYYCNSVNKRSGNFCGDHHRWGRDRSQQMQLDYLAARKNSRSPEEQINDIEDQDTPADLPEHIRADLQEQPEIDVGDIGGSAGADGTGHHIEPAKQEFGGWGLFEH